MIKVKKQSKILRYLSYLLVGLSSIYLLLFFVYLISPTNSRLHDRLPRLNRRLFHELIYGKIIKAAINVFETDRSNFERVLPHYEIRIKRELWEDLDKKRAEGIRNKYYKATLIKDNVYYPVNVRYRGDMPTHWKSAKKSWRVKTLKGESIEKQRLHNFITPQRYNFFNDFLVYKMAGELGMMAPLSEFVTLNVNKKYYGVFYKTEQVDRYFQIRNWKMEGSIYALETFDPVNAEKSWTGERPWDVQYKSGRDKKADEEMLPELLRRVRDPKSTYAEIKKLLNVEEAAKWKALTLIFQSLHIDKGHNHKLYHDPTDGKFHYVPWDVGTMEDELDLYLIANPMDKKLFSFPEYLYLVQQYIHEITQELFPFDRVKEIIENEYQRILPFVQREEFKEYRHMAFTMTDFERKKDRMLQILSQRYKQYEKVFKVKSAKQLDENTIVFDSEVPLRITTLEGGEYTLHPRIDYLPKDMSGIPSPWRLEPLQIGFGLTRGDIEGTITKVDNAITGEAVVLSNKFYEIDKIQKGKVKEVFNKYKEIYWEGIVEVKETIIIKENEKLIVAPGTEILIDPKISILIYGNAQLIGNQEQPIIVRSSNPSEPFGTFAVQSSTREVNRFHYTKFSNGRDGRFDGIFYTGMLSIFNSKSEIKNSFFTKSFGDDGVNIKMGESLIENNVFFKTGFDALDMDFTKGVVKGNLFLRAGNDGVDCGTATPRVYNNLIIGSADKGISLGEYSDANISNNMIIGNVLGVATKDSSTPVVRNNIFYKNEIGLTAYRKKLMYYGPRFAETENCYIMNNKDMDSDVFSKITKESTCFKMGEGLAQAYNQRMKYYFDRFPEIQNDSWGTLK